MFEIGIRDINNNEKGKMGLSESIFGSSSSESVVHTAVVSYLANQRQGTHSTKTKGMVRGGGRKPWKQKGTGRARSGSNRSPLWRGGGIIFGPQPRDYSVKLPHTMRRVALHKALTMKFSDNQILVLDSIPEETKKTKEMVNILKNLGLSGKSVLIVLPEQNHNIVLSARNIPRTDVMSFADLNAYSIALYDAVLFTAEAITRLQSSGEVRP
ncbi:MAG: 50S ribosomal protein L4 [Dissulfurispiraceae bacterium]